MLTEGPARDYTGFQSSKSVESALTTKDHLVTDSIFKTGSQLNPDIILQKDVYDKIAASIILGKFVEFYNDPDATTIKDEYMEMRSV